MRLLTLASVLSLIGVGLLTGIGPFPTGAPETADERDAVSGAVASSAHGTPVPEDGMSGGTEHGAVVHVTEQRYPVSGTTERDILHSMRTDGPNTGGSSFFGLTGSESSFQIQPRMDGEHCVADDVRVELAVTITLPEWEPIGDAPYEVQRDWSRFSTALKRHEDGHRQIAADGANATREALQQLRRTTCGQVEADARQLAQRIADQTEAEHIRYDRETDHGRTQGAEWPLP
ncbi:MAG: hypothetical protein Rubg2KO_03310 [Rubricoccaceae bacterium]